MKIDGLDHPKTLDLAARLDISLPQTIGHLELLWAFVAQKTPRGNIGKWPDGTIARAAHWNNDPTVFVTALADAGFLDACNQHRFIVHDWQEHCPRWVKAKLAKTDQNFVIPDYSKDCRADYSADSSADSPRARSPSQAKPSQAKPITSPNGDASSKPDDGPTNCPAEKIVEIYHETLPELPRVKILDNGRRQKLRTRWRESPKHRDLDFWRAYFNTVRKSGFLMGEKKDWRADFDFLITPSKFRKVIEGSYEDGTETPTA